MRHSLPNRGHNPDPAKTGMVIFLHRLDDERNQLRRSRHRTRLLPGVKRDIYREVVP